MADTYSYTAVFNYADDGISISFPDLPGCLSCAHSANEAARRAEDVLGLYMYGLEFDGADVPEPTELNRVVLEEGDVPVLVSVFMPPVRLEMENQNRVVKKTLALPEWLYDAAKRRGGDFSQLVQTSLVRYLEPAE